MSLGDLFNSMMGQVGTHSVQIQKRIARMQYIWELANPGKTPKNAYEVIDWTIKQAHMRMDDMRRRKARRKKQEDPTIINAEFTEVKE